MSPAIVATTAPRIERPQPAELEYPRLLPFPVDESSQGILVELMLERVALFSVRGAVTVPDITRC